MLENSLDRHLGLGLRDSRFPDHFVDDIEFDQARLRVRQLDDRVELTGMSSNVASTVDPVRFRTACSKFATGITVITVLGQDRLPYGMTANSFTSVSLDPPLILVCIDRKATMLPRLEATRNFGVNVLCDSQKELSNQFAKSGHNQFENVAWTPGESDVPLLDNALATFECEIKEIVEAGDHRIFLADVLHLACFDGSPLLYFGSGYRLLS